VTVVEYEFEKKFGVDIFAYDLFVNVIEYVVFELYDEVL
jgi:hypothetical protein